MAAPGRDHASPLARLQTGETGQIQCIYRTLFQTRAAAHLAVFRYIEVFYNRTRRHSYLGYFSPDAFEARHAAA